MKYLHLLWRSLMRRKVRTLLTLLGFVVAFVLFGYLAAIQTAFSMGIDMAGNDRLMLMHKISLMQLLPESYLEQIRATPGVVDACSNTYFGGYYKEPRNNSFMQMPLDPECQLRMYPEIKLSESEKKAWIADQQGAIVGRDTAKRFGWKVGDRVPLQATIWRKKDNSTTWEFNIDGIFDGAPGTDTSSFFFHYKYFDEGRLFGTHNVGWYIVRVAEPAKAAEVAARLDALFANSMAETKTTTEKAFLQSFAKQMGDIGLIAQSVGAAVFFTLLLGVGNTMAQSVRERTSELAVLKALGFTDGSVLMLVLAESCLLALGGGGGGLALAWGLISLGGDPTNGMLPGFFLPTRALLFGVALVLGLGFVAGVFPAIRAMRLRIVDALRRA